MPYVQLACERVAHMPEKISGIIARFELRHRCSFEGVFYSLFDHFTELIVGKFGILETMMATIEVYVKADIEKINETLPTYKQMLRVIVTEQEMIKTTTGKVKRYEEAKKM